MSRQVFVLDRGIAAMVGSKVISSSHGLALACLRACYYCDRDSQNGFESAKKGLRASGWMRNYSTDEVESVYEEVSNAAYFLNESDIDYSIHTVARL